MEKRKSDLLLAKVKEEKAKIEKEQEAIINELAEKKAQKEKAEAGIIFGVKVSALKEDIEDLELRLQTPFLTYKDYRNALKNWLVEIIKEQAEELKANTEAIESREEAIKKAEAEIEELRAKRTDIKYLAEGKAQETGMPFDMSLWFGNYESAEYVKNKFAEALKKYE